MPSPAAASTSTATDSSPKPAKFKTPTCVLCRKRKLRCDGGNPCGPCTRTRTPVVCTYVPKTVGQLRSELPKGGACITCRYAPLPLFLVQKAHSLPHWGDSDNAKGTSSNSSSSRPTTPQYTAGGLELHADAALDLSGLDTLFSWDPSLELSTQCGFSPRESSVGYDSESTLARNLFLEHRYHYGLGVSANKFAAIANGDISGIAIHPALVHAAELLGTVQRYQSHPEGWLSFNSQSAAEVELEALVRKALDTPDAQMDPLTAVQTTMMLCLYSAQKEDIYVVLETLAKASKLFIEHADTFAAEGDLCEMFVPSSGFGLPGNVKQRPQLVPSPYLLSARTHAEEVRAAIAQIVFMDIGCRLLLSLPSNVDPALVDRFRRLTTLHNDTTSNFLRAKSFLLLLDAQTLLHSWGNINSTPPSEWSKRYRALVSQVQEHVAFVDALLHQASAPGYDDPGAVVVLRVTALAARGALTQLYGLFATRGAQAQFAETVHTVVHIISEFKDSDYEFLDPPLGIALVAVARTINGVDPSVLGYNGAQQAVMVLNDFNVRLRQGGPYSMQL
uniref:Zn(2)-C6 fungal-type domain-containing protein n=1 Tax=Mycena chlorophos TaxID=658473 RepID=A0ABQ0L623_MYCCL|nr:predicted protein [Mycena chlorophos]